VCLYLVTVCLYLVTVARLGSEATYKRLKEACPDLNRPRDRPECPGMLKVTLLSRCFHAVSTLFHAVLTPITDVRPCSRWRRRLEISRIDPSRCGSLCPYIVIITINLESLSLQWDVYDIYDTCTDMPHFSSPQPHLHPATPREWTGTSDVHGAVQYEARQPHCHRPVIALLTPTPSLHEATCPYIVIITI